MKIELSLRELKVLLRWARMLSAPKQTQPNLPSSLRERVIDTLAAWRVTHAEKHMPLWKLTRKLRIGQNELLPVLEQLIADGNVTFVHLQTKGRPTSGYNLTQ